MRQLGDDGGKELAVGADGAGAAGAVDAGVREGACAEATVAGAGAGTGLGEAARTGIEAAQELVLEPVETLL